MGNVFEEFETLAKEEEQTRDAAKSMVANVKRIADFVANWDRSVMSDTLMSQSPIIAFNSDLANFDALPWPSSPEMRTTIINAINARTKLLNFHTALPQAQRHLLNLPWRQV